MNLKKEYKLAVLEKIKSEIRKIEEKINEEGKVPLVQNSSCSGSA